MAKSNLEYITQYPRSEPLERMRLQVIGKKCITEIILEQTLIRKLKEGAAREELLEIARMLGEIAV